MGIALSLLALAAAQAETGAPPVLVPLVAPADIEGAPLRQPVGADYRCTTGYGDCLRIDRTRDDGVGRLELFDMDAAARAIPAMTLPAAVAIDDGMDIMLWDFAIRLAHSPRFGTANRVYLIGLMRATPVAYSGGFASGQRLHLFELAIIDGGATLGPELVSLPWNSEAQIRACFGEDDRQRRRDACHDIYRYVPALAIAAARQGDYPVLTYSTTATAYPRTARRGEDSTVAPPLTAADLTEWRDPECSYSRTLRYNPATERYEMDRIAPDCSAYTVP